MQHSDEGWRWGGISVGFGFRVSFSYHIDALVTTYLCLLTLVWISASVGGWKTV